MYTAQPPREEQQVKVESTKPLASQASVEEPKKVEMKVAAENPFLKRTAAPANNGITKGKGTDSDVFADLKQNAANAVKRPNVSH